MSVVVGQNTEGFPHDERLTDTGLKYKLLIIKQTGTWDKQNIRHSKFKYKGTKKVFSLLTLWNSSVWAHLNSFPDMAVKFIFKFPPLP